MIQPYGRTVTLASSNSDKILNGDGEQVTSREINGRQIHILIYDRVNKVWSLGWLST